MSAKPWEVGYQPDEKPAGKPDYKAASDKALAARWEPVTQTKPPPSSGVQVVDLNNVAPGDTTIDDLDNMPEPPVISLKRKIFYDGFINEYLIDFDPQLAYIRNGGSESSKNQAYRILKEPYVAKQLQIVAQAMTDEQMCTRADIILGLKKEANFVGIDSSSGARVKAWSVLAKIMGIEAPKRQEIEVKHRGGVMLVPAARDLNEWELMASDGQTRLKEDVRK